MTASSMSSSRFEGEVAELPQPLLRTSEEALRVGQQHAVFEAEVDVLALRPDPGEVPDPAAIGQRVGDPAPPGTNRFDAAGNRPEDQLTQRSPGLADRVRILVEEELGRKGKVHGAIMPRQVAATCQVSAAEVGRRRPPRSPNAVYRERRSVSPTPCSTRAL